MGLLTSLPATITHQRIWNVYVNWIVVPYMIGLFLTTNFFQVKGCGWSKFSCYRTSTYITVDSMGVATIATVFRNNGFINNPCQQSLTKEYGNCLLTGPSCPLILKTAFIKFPGTLLAKYDSGSQLNSRALEVCACETMTIREYDARTWLIETGSDLELTKWYDRAVESNHTVYCEAQGRKTKGIFFDQNPFEGTFDSFICQLIIMGLAYQLAYFFLFRPFKQPKFVCSVLVGILVSPNMGLLRETYVVTDHVMYLYKVFAAIGVTYFIFIISVKMDVSMIRRTAKDATIIGTTSVLTPFLVVLILCLQMQISPKENTFFNFLFSAGLSVTRFPNIAYAFDELNLLTSELGQLVLSCSMINEITTWMWLVVGIFLRSQNVYGWYFLVSAALFFLVAVLIIRPLMKWIISNTPEGKPVRNGYVLAILVGVLVLSSITDMFGSMHFGILVLGLVIPDGPPLGSEIVKKAELIVMEIFMPMYYIAVGNEVNLSSLATASASLKETYLVVILGFLVKFLGGLFSALSRGIKPKRAALLGLMMNIKGPLDLHLFYRWFRRHEITEPTYALLVLSHLVITGIVTPLIEIFYSTNDRLNDMTGTTKRAIQLTPRNTELRILSCIHNEDNVLGTLCLLEASNATETSPICAYLVQCEELVGRATPIMIPHNKAMARTTSKKSYNIMRAVGKYLKNSNVFTTVKTFSVIAPYRTMHENINTLAHKEKVSLIIVPFQKNNHDLDYAQSATLHNVNTNITRWAPCTVGILVDKGMHKRCMTNNNHFTCNVAVVFIGGADDREALTIGARMSTHSEVNLTVLYIKRMNRMCNTPERLVEKKLDDALLGQFKTNVISNRRVEFLEAYVDDGASVISATQSLKGKYDLVIVGQQSEATKNDFNELMLSVWNEHPELGILGELIASEDFHEGMTSVLVMQHGGRDLPQFVPDKVNMNVTRSIYLRD